VVLDERYYAPLDIGKDCRTASFTWTGQQNASYGTANPGAWSAMRRFIKLVSILLKLRYVGQPSPQSRCTDHLSQRSAMGQHRQSQGNDRQNSARQKSGKQQHADSVNASSRASVAHGPKQQQQDPGTGRSPRGSGDGSAPRAGGKRNADNPSLSANQQDRRGQSGSQRGGDSVEALQDQQDSQDSKG
jgi:uncharacterized protein involved in copper resistance